MVTKQHTMILEYILQPKKFDTGMSMNRVLLLCVWILHPWLLVAYQAPEDKEDIFTTRACPAFLIFDSAAYVADMTIELPCHCKPEDALSVVWYYQKHLGTQSSQALTDFAGTAVLDSSEVGRGVALRARFTIRLFSLLVFMAQESDSGHYVCGTRSGEYFYGYNVDVQLVRKVLFSWSLVQRSRAREAGAGQPERYQVFTSYRPWSVCDRCGTRGEQTRLGLCYVMSQYLQVRYLRQPRGVISCGSSAVPASFGLADGHHGAELDVRSCHTPCPLMPAASPQQQSMLDFLGYGGPNSLRLPIYYHNHPEGSDLVLSCPGATGHQVVAWDRGPVPLYRSRYMNGRSQRVFIGTGQQLHFQPAQARDKGIYYCWLRGRKVAEIRLAVHPRVAHLRRISDPESLFALRTILISYACLTAGFLLILSVRFVWDVSKERRATHSLD